MKKTPFALLAAASVLLLTACGGSAASTGAPAATPPAENRTEVSPMEPSIATSSTAQALPEGFVLIPGGSFVMGSPEAEAWRSDDETQHEVTVSDFFMSTLEVTQAEYTALMGVNPSNFVGEAMPVESLTWLDAIAYCNARSEAEGRTPVYTLESDGMTVSWDRTADGYRLPTEAEWEYACRAGTLTPFNTETSISAEEANYYGHYPYEIEGNYFEQQNLTTQPGIYRGTTISVGSFEPNALGLYDMHGNVGEWVWDWYGAYDTAAQTDPTGPETGTLRVYRGGGWNDFAKNMRSGYRATLEQNQGSFNIGLRLVLNAAAGSGSVVGASAQHAAGSDAGRALIVYFSWSGNTEGAAEEIAAQTGFDVFELTMVEPYSTDYNTVLQQAQQDQHDAARPALAAHVADMAQYDTILLGYPNWWASIPMPVATFLEEYDFTGKIILPFCSNGGGEFGQSLTAITKLVPGASLGEPLSIHYSGGATLSADIDAWLTANDIPHQ